VALIHDSEVWQARLAALPLETYDVGETVFAEGTKTGRLLILKSGAVSIVRSGIEIATVSKPGAVFGELSALLDEPHSADVRFSTRPSFTSRTPPHSWGRTRPRFFTSAWF